MGLTPADEDRTPHCALWSLQTRFDVWPLAVGYLDSLGAICHDADSRSRCGCLGGARRGYCRPRNGVSNRNSGTARRTTLLVSGPPCRRCRTPRMAHGVDQSGDGETPGFEDRDQTVSGWPSSQSAFGQRLPADPHEDALGRLALIPVCVRSTPTRRSTLRSYRFGCHKSHRSTSRKCPNSSTPTSRRK